MNRCIWMITQIVIFLDSDSTVELIFGQVQK